MSDAHKETAVSVMRKINVTCEANELQIDWTSRVCVGVCACAWSCTINIEIIKLQFNKLNGREHKYLSWQMCACHPYNLIMRKPLKLLNCTKAKMDGCDTWGVLKWVWLVEGSASLFTSFLI